MHAVHKLSDHVIEKRREFYLSFKVAYMLAFAIESILQFPNPQK